MGVRWGLARPDAVIRAHHGLLAHHGGDPEWSRCVGGCSLPGARHHRRRLCYPRLFSHGPDPGMTRILACPGSWRVPDPLMDRTSGRSPPGNDQDRSGPGGQTDRNPMVPQAGLEPARRRRQQILSLPRLPISPLGRRGGDHSRRRRRLQPRRNQAVRKEADTKHAAHHQGHPTDRVRVMVDAAPAIDPVRSQPRLYQSGVTGQSGDG